MRRCNTSAKSRHSSKSRHRSSRVILRQAEPTHAPHALEPLSLETPTHPHRTRYLRFRDHWLSSLSDCLQASVGLCVLGLGYRTLPPKTEARSREGWRESQITVTRTSDPRGYSPIPQSGAEAGRAVVHWADSRAVDKDSKLGRAAESLRWWLRSRPSTWATQCPCRRSPHHGAT